MSSTTDPATDPRAPVPTTRAEAGDVTLVDMPVQPLRADMPAASATAEPGVVGSASAASVLAAPVSAESRSASGAACGPPGLLARARAEGVTGPAVVALAVAVVGVGVAFDLRFASGFSFGTVVTVLGVAVAAPTVVRFRSLATAAVLPPLLMAGAVAVIGRLSGQDHGTRELALDVGTTLALWAPALFAATVASILVVLVRVGRRIIR